MTEYDTDITFAPIFVDGRQSNWLYASDGRLIPNVRGGSEEGGEGGDGEGEPPEGGDSGGEGTPPPDPAASTKVEMTQAELDKLIDQRLGRAKSKWESDTKAAAEREKMDEAERLKAEKADAEKAAADRVSGANRRIITAEAKLAAVAAGVKPDRVARFLRNVDLDDIDVDDDGNLDEAAVAKAVEAALAEVPEFKGEPAPAGASGGEHNGNGAPKKFTRAQIDAMSVEEFEANKDAIMASLQGAAAN